MNRFETSRRDHPWLAWAVLGLCALLSLGSHCDVESTDNQHDRDADIGDAGDQQPAEEAWKELSAGKLHTCGIDADDQLHCWGVDDGGSSDYGQVRDAPSGTFRTVTVAGHATCAIELDGTLHCWGDESFGRLAEAPDQGSFIDVGIGWTSACAIDEDNELHCWGIEDPSEEYEHGQVREAPSGAFEEVAMGSYHGCALGLAGNLECWGIETGHEWRDGGQVTERPPGAFEQLSSGAWMSCGIDTAGIGHCWGGSQTTDYTYTSTGEIAAISAGGEHFCVVEADGAVDCWGNFHQHQPDELEERKPGPFLEVAAGGSHNCAVRADTGEPTCWGTGGSGQLDPP